MPRKPGKVPSYCRHKKSGQAVVYFGRKAVYLGPFCSSESHQNYEREIARWRVAQESGIDRETVAIDRAAPKTVSELILAYLLFAKTYYVDADGKQTKEFTEMKLALRPLRKVHGSTYVENFGPLALKAVRTHMVESGKLSRQVINRRVNRIRRMFKWAVAEELCGKGTHEALRAVEALKQGRTKAHEAPPIKAVPQVFVDAVVKAASPHIAAMIQLQQLGAMRPAEVTAMRTCELDTSRDVWIYQPYSHKNRWRGKDRSPIFLGPQAQVLLRPFLNRSTEAYLFSPIEAEEWRNAQRRRNRQTPMTPSQSRRIAKKNPKKAKRERYDTDSYRRAIKYVIKRINRERQQREESPMPQWCPLQLRHRRATDIRKKYGIEAAQLFLGHEHATVTEVYAERDLESGLRIARELG